MYTFLDFMLFEDVPSLDMISVCDDLVGLEDVSCASYLVIDYFSCSVNKY